MMSHNGNPDLSRLRAQRIAAERDRRSLLGDLVEVLRAHPGKYPRRVGAILEKIDGAELRAKDCADGIGRLLETGAGDSVHDQRARDRISALIAHHVEGLELLPSPTKPGRWMQVDPANGSHRPVANYAGDYGAARRALEAFPTELLGKAVGLMMGQHIAPGALKSMDNIVAVAAAVLMAPPVDLCLGMLTTLGISPKDAPPTIAE